MEPWLASGLSVGGTSVVGSVSTTLGHVHVLVHRDGLRDARLLVVDGLLHEVSSLVDASFTEPPRQPGGGSRAERNLPPR